MKATDEKKIIVQVIRQAIKKHYGSITRHDAARAAAEAANRRGVNVSSAPYRQTFFREILDKKEADGAFCDSAE